MRHRRIVQKPLWTKTFNCGCYISQHQKTRQIVLCAQHRRNLEIGKVLAKFDKSKHGRIRKVETLMKKIAQVS